MSLECLDVVQCRACINECVEFQHLHELIELRNEPTTLAMMLAACTNLEIPNEEDDILPMYLCKSCAIKLQEAYLFKEMVLQTHEQLSRNVHVEYAVEEMYEKPAQHSSDDDVIVDVDDTAQNAPEDKDEFVQITQELIEEEEEHHLVISEVKDEETYEEYLDIDSLEVDDDLHYQQTHEDDSQETILTNTIDDSNEDTKNMQEGGQGGSLFTCEVCGRNFNQRSRLCAHLQTHSDKKEFICEYCGKALKNMKCYKHHLLTHTEEKKHKCNECGRMFRNASNLHVHMRTHTGEKPYKCSHCELAFVTLELMKRHVFLHTGERPYACDQCDKRYRDVSNLRAHQRTHDPMKMFKCEICGVRLTQKAGYKKHMLVHTGEMPHKCDICQRSFRFSSNLLAHVRLHSGEKPFKCAKCHKAFPTAKRLRLHSKVHEYKPPREPRKPIVRRGGPLPDVPDQKVVKSNVVLLY